jgi:TolA-binding protein
MKKISILLLIANLSLLAAEPSAYGAGNLNSSTPYGLTSSEEHILKNKEKVSTLDKSVGNVKIQLSQIDENYEGLRSVTEAMGSKISQINQKIIALDEESNSRRESFIVLNQEVSDLKAYVEASRELQDKNQEKIKTVLSELGSLIDSINTNYTSKSDFSKLEARLESLETKPLKNSNDKQKVVSSTKSGATLLAEGMSLFEEKSYEQSKVRFEALVEKNYKPARSNYFLGEIAYAQESYKEAIVHYQKSISLYDKADYIPRLLYHTGISFSKLKETTQSKQFFDALKQGYPDSKEAKSLN